MLLVSDFECFMFIFLLLSSFIYFIFRVLTVLMWSVESRWCWRDQEVYDWRRLTTFTKLIGSKEDIVQVNSIDNLLGMCFKDEQKREVFVRQGGIQELVSVLSDPNLLSSSELCFGSPSCLKALMSCKFLDPLMYLLSNGRSPFKNQPWRLRLGSVAYQKRLRDNGRHWLYAWVS